MTIWTEEKYLPSLDIRLYNIKSNIWINALSVFKIVFSIIFCEFHKFDMVFLNYPFSLFIAIKWSLYFFMKNYQNLNLNSNVFHFIDFFIGDCCLYVTLIIFLDKIVMKFHYFWNRIWKNCLIGNRKISTRRKHLVNNFQIIYVPMMTFMYFFFWMETIVIKFIHLFKYSSGHIWNFYKKLIYGCRQWWYLMHITFSSV